MIMMPPSRARRTDSLRSLSTSFRSIPLRFLLVLGAAALTLATITIVDNNNNNNNNNGEVLRLPVFASAASSASVARDDLTTNRSIRIGMIGAYVGDIGAMMIAVVDGVRVAAHEANSKGGIAGRQIEIINANTGDNKTRVPAILHHLMANASTELDIIAFMPGRGHIDYAMANIPQYNLSLFAPVSGDRQDHQGAFMRNKFLATPIPDSEVEAILRVFVLERQLKRIAVVVTRGFPLGVDLLDYIAEQLDGFGLSITFVFALEDPEQPLNLQIAQAVGLRVQALIVLAALYPSTAEFLGAFLTVLPDAHMAATGLCFAIVSQLFQAAPLLLRDGNVLSTLFTPLPTDDSLRIMRHMRTVVPAAQHLLTNHQLVYDAVSILGMFFAAGYTYTTALFHAFETIGANGINRHTISDTLYSKRIFEAMDWRVGPFSDTPCGDYGDAVGSSMCECNGGSRMVTIGKLNRNAQLETMTEHTIKFSMDVCHRIRPAIQSPLIQLIPSIVLVSGDANNSSKSMTTMASAKEVDAAVQRAAASFIRGDRAGSTNRVTTPSSRTGIIITANHTTLTELETMEKDRLITISVGGIFNDDVTAKASNLSIILEPSYINPRLYSGSGSGGSRNGGYSPRVVHLTATLEQEIHALASVYATRSGGITIISSTSWESEAEGGGDGEGMLAALSTVFTKSANTFGAHFTNPSIGAATIADGLRAVSSSSNGGGGVGSGASRSGAFFVHGISSSGDVKAVCDFLAANPASVVLLPFQHLTLWFETIIATIYAANNDDDANSIAARIVYATNIPSWDPDSTTTAAKTSFMQSYFAAVGANATTAGDLQGKMKSSPRSLLGFLSQRLIANIVERIPGRLTQDTFISTLFAVSVVVVDADAGFTVGPLSSTACVKTSSSSSSSSGASSSSSSATNCETNFGARRVEVRSLSTANVALESISAFTFGASGRVEYRPLPEPEGADVLAIVVGVVVGSLGVTIALFVALFLLCGGKGRSHKHAPKDPNVAFTMVFTDIQSSTNLWAEEPEAMTVALELHHLLIRELIADHRGYEVKTIGDSFMIAFKSADDAVRFACQLQLTFFNHRGFPAAIDSAYLSFDREKLMEASSRVVMLMGTTADGTAATEADMQKCRALSNLSVHLSEEEYKMVWSGLRVRVGIHTAFGEIKKDEVTHAYDYYGTVTNTAARVEAVCHGGQVCITQGTLTELSEVEILLQNEGMTPTACAVVRVSPRASLQMPLPPVAATPISASPPKPGAASDSYHELTKSGGYQQNEGGGGGGGGDFGSSMGGSPRRPSPHRTSHNNNNNTKNGGKKKKKSNNNHPSGGEPSSLYARALGPVELRGLANEVLLFQLECIPGRAFPPLRLDAADMSTSVALNQNNKDTFFEEKEGGPEDMLAAADDNGGEGDRDSNSSIIAPSLTASHFASGSRYGGGGGGGSPIPDDLHLAQAMACIAALLGPLPAKQKSQELKRLMEQWKIGAVDAKKAVIGGVTATAATAIDPSSIGVGMGDQETPQYQPLRALAQTLAKGDPFVAAALDALAQRIRGVALRNLKNAATATNAVVPVLGGLTRKETATAATFTTVPQQLRQQHNQQLEKHHPLAPDFGGESLMPMASAADSASI